MGLNAGASPLYAIAWALFAIALIAFGSFVAFVVYKLCKSLINNPLALKENYSDKSISSLGGLIVIGALLISATVFGFFPKSFYNGKGDVSGPIYQAPISLLLIVIGFALLGLIDDIFGDKEHQGFKGHISALLKGKITTGAIKLFGGPIIAFVTLVPLMHYNTSNVFLDVIAISLVANVFNLLDLSPGRCSKYAIFGLIPGCFLFVYGSYQYWIIGIVAMIMVLDLRERFMLGDAGANALGAMVGFNLVVGGSDALYGSPFQSNTLSIVVIAIALGLNLLSEFVSFSKIINGFFLLRWFDELGQTKQRKAWNKSKRESGSSK